MPDLDLLLGAYNIPSTTSGSVSILVNVDEQVNCDGLEGLAITVTLTGGAVDMTAMRADFMDGIITFTSVSAGAYTCTVAVEGDNGFRESMQIPCTSSESG